mmetsp:Transcript_4221/g.11014  ORF Transcript_4221/g.11014 Transcript_4221/m.11014 type:complete len:217 (+) Transcript_4221:692-1342(+)
MFRDGIPQHHDIHTLRSKLLRRVLGIRLRLFECFVPRFHQLFHLQNARRRGIEAPAVVLDDGKTRREIGIVPIQLHQLLKGLTGLRLGARGHEDRFVFWLLRRKHAIRHRHAAGVDDAHEDGQHHGDRQDGCHDESVAGGFPYRQSRRIVGEDAVVVGTLAVIMIWRLDLQHGGHQRCHVIILIFCIIIGSKRGRHLFCCALCAWCVVVVVVRDDV